MSPAEKRGPPTSGLSALNWQFIPTSHRPADSRPSWARSRHPCFSFSFWVLTLGTQRHRPGMEWRASCSAQAQRRSEKGKLVDPIARQFLQPHDLQHWDAHLGNQIEVHREIVPRNVGRRLVFNGSLVGANDHGTVPLNEPLCGLDVDAWSICEEPLWVLPDGHPPGADRHHVALLQANALPVYGRLQILRGDRIAVGQHGDALSLGHVQQYPASDDRRHLLGATLRPVPAAQMLPGGEVVPDLTRVAPMVQCVDVCAAVGVHSEYIA